MELHLEIVRNLTIEEGNVSNITAEIFVGTIFRGYTAIFTDEWAYITHTDQLTEYCNNNIIPQIQRPWSAIIILYSLLNQVFDMDIVDFIEADHVMGRW